MDDNQFYPDDGKRYPQPQPQSVPPPYSSGPGPSTYGPVPGSASPGISVNQQAPYMPQPQAAWGYPQPPPQPYQQYPPAGAPMMYPPPPPPQQQQQQQQQVVVIGGGGGGHQQQQIHYQAVDSYCGQIAMSCFVFWCCNWLFGLIAFILAMVASNTAIGDPKGARQMGKASYGMSIAGIIVTVVVISIVVGVLVGTTSGTYYYNSGTGSNIGTGTGYGYSIYPSCRYKYGSTCYSTYSCSTSSWICYISYTNSYYISGCCYHN